MRMSTGLTATAPQPPSIFNYNFASMYSTALSSSCTLNGHKTQLCTFFLSRYFQSQEGSLVKDVLLGHVLMLNHTGVASNL